MMQDDIHSSMNPKIEEFSGGRYCWLFIISNGIHLFYSASYFWDVTNGQVQESVDKLNNRPESSMGYNTPNQKSFGIYPFVAIAS